MAKTRSPNYPALSLGEAIALMAKIHEKDMRNRMSRETVADHLGYKSLSGPALGKLAALRAYGLLDGSGDDLRVSDAAVTIIADEPSSGDRQQEIQNAAFRPKLFQSLYDHFDGQRPSEANLRSYMIKEDFTPTAAEKVVHIYLDTFDLASREGGGYYSEDEQAGGTAKNIIMTQEIPVRHRERPHEVAGVEVIRTRLTPTVTGMVEFHGPGPVTQGAIEKLVWYLEGVKDTYPVSIEDKEED